MICSFCQGLEKEGVIYWLKLAGEFQLSAFPRVLALRKGVSNDLGNLRRKQVALTEAFSLLAPVSISAFLYTLPFLSFSGNEQG